MKLSPLLVFALLTGLVPCVHAETPAPAANAAKVEPMGVITGKPIARADGRWFGLTMEGPKLQLNFYDKNKMPEPADRIRGVLKIDPTGRAVERDVMNPAGDGSSLVSNKPVRAPWIFRVYITLIDADENAVETLVEEFNRSEADAMTAQAEAEAVEKPAVAQ